MELSATQLPGTTKNGGGNGRKGILHEAAATEHAPVPAAELPSLGFDPGAVAAELEDGSAEDALRWALNTFGERMYIACSFQKTSSVTVHLAHSISPDARFFYLDTDVEVAENYEIKACL